MSMEVSFIGLRNLFRERPSNEVEQQNLNHEEFLDGLSRLMLGESSDEVEEETVAQQKTLKTSSKEVSPNPSGPRDEAQADRGPRTWHNLEFRLEDQNGPAPVRQTESGPSVRPRRPVQGLPCGRGALYRRGPDPDHPHGGSYVAYHNERARRLGVQRERRRSSPAELGQNYSRESTYEPEFDENDPIVKSHICNHKEVQCFLDFYTRGTCKFCEKACIVRAESFYVEHWFEEEEIELNPPTGEQRVTPVPPAVLIRDSPVPFMDRSIFPEAGRVERRDPERGDLSMPPPRGRGARREGFRPRTYSVHSTLGLEKDIPDIDPEDLVDDDSDEDCDEELDVPIDLPEDLKENKNKCSLLSAPQEDSESVTPPAGRDITPSLMDDNVRSLASTDSGSTPSPMEEGTQSFPATDSAGSDSPPSLMEESTASLPTHDSPEIPSLLLERTPTPPLVFPRPNPQVQTVEEESSPPTGGKLPEGAAADAKGAKPKSKDEQGNF